MVIIGFLCALTSFKERLKSLIVLVTTIEVEAFAITVPRILKEIHTKSNGKNLLLAPYTLVHVLVPPDLNKTCCDCGVYALKYIECHFMGLSLDMLDDVNIKDARLRIAVDLWKAAFDPVFIDRMTKYKPPKINSEIIDIA
ncbi:unnamed protein product [Arabidopsis thaliana]|uniref:Ubiquitin-like protease family profile domain-containing protein n=2 Tax=Arabidopsis thaliana TaxID=3702 RepID=A0A5S9WXL3_ARATH|nr:unnamed protein product [Arabidopsis thaliana]